MSKAGEYDMAKKKQSYVQRYKKEQEQGINRKALIWYLSIFGGVLLVVILLLLLF